MWQPPIPIIHRGRALTGAEAWIHTFAQAWEALEVDPEELNMGGFRKFGAAALAKYSDESPATVAARLYPDAGEFRHELYPAYGDEPDTQAPEVVAAPVAPVGPAVEWQRLKDEDVPF